MKHVFYVECTRTKEARYWIWQNIVKEKNGLVALWESNLYVEKSFLSTCSTGNTFHKALVKLILNIISLRHSNEMHDKICKLKNAQYCWNDIRFWDLIFPLFNSGRFSLQILNCMLTFLPLIVCKQSCL